MHLSSNSLVVSSDALGIVPMNSLCHQTSHIVLWSPRASLALKLSKWNSWSCHRMVRGPSFMLGRAQAPGLPGWAASSRAWYLRSWRYLLVLGRASGGYPAGLTGVTICPALTLESLPNHRRKRVRLHSLHPRLSKRPRLLGAL